MRGVAVWQLLRRQPSEGAGRGLREWYSLEDASVLELRLNRADICTIRSLDRKTLVWAGRSACSCSSSSRDAQRKQRQGDRKLHRCRMESCERASEAIPIFDLPSLYTMLPRLMQSSSVIVDGLQLSSWRTMSNTKERGILAILRFGVDPCLMGVITLGPVAPQHAGLPHMMESHCAVSSRSY